MKKVRILTLVFLSLIIGYGSFILIYAQETENTDVFVSVPDDIDSDGMPNAWELANGLDPVDDSDASLDPDNDNLNNLQEYTQNTDPNDQDSDDDCHYDGFEVSYGTDPLDDTSYPSGICNVAPTNTPTPTLSPTLTPTNTPTNVPTNTPTLTPSPTSESSDEDPTDDSDDESDDEDDEDDEDEQDLNPTSTPVLISPTTVMTPTSSPIIDSDGDGLTDEEERKLGLNINSLDTDKDGLGDYIEVKQYKTNPTLKDTDADGLTDREELIIYQTDPLKWDSDQGGVSDGDELKNHTNPLYKEDDVISGIELTSQGLNLIEKVSKIDTVAGLDINLKINQVNNIKYIFVEFANHHYLMQNNADIVLTSPDQPGNYELKIIYVFENNRRYQYSRQIEIKPAGKIYKKYPDWLGLFNQRGYFLSEPIKEVEVDVLVYDKATNQWDELSKSINITSDNDGFYRLIVEPQRDYKVRFHKPGYHEQELLVQKQTHSSLSINQDIYMPVQMSRQVLVTTVSVSSLTIAIYGLLQILIKFSLFL